MPLAARALLFTLVAPGTVAGLVPWWLVTRGDRLPLGGLRWTVPGQGLVGWALVAAGALFYLACVRDFVVRGRGTPFPLDAPRRFVAVGLYRHVRNPMYVSIGCVLAGEALATGAPVLLLWLGALWALFHAFVVLYEEPHLGRVFGATYARYRGGVPRWVPRLSPFRDPETGVDGGRDGPGGTDRAAGPAGGS